MQRCPHPRHRPLRQPRQVSQWRATHRAATVAQTAAAARAHVVCINVMLSPFSSIRPGHTNIGVSGGPTLRVAWRLEYWSIPTEVHCILDWGQRLSSFTRETVCAVRTQGLPRFPLHGDLLSLVQDQVHVLVKALPRSQVQQPRRAAQAVRVTRGDPCARPSAGRWGAHDDAALDAQVRLLEQPDLHLLPALQEPENQVLQRHARYSVRSAASAVTGVRPQAYRMQSSCATGKAAHNGLRHDALHGAWRKGAQHTARSAPAASLVLRCCGQVLAHLVAPPSWARFVRARRSACVRLSLGNAEA